jgi:hypothetical protein
VTSLTNQGLLNGLSRDGKIHAEGDTRTGESHDQFERERFIERTRSRLDDESTKASGWHESRSGREGRD